MITSRILFACILLPSSLLAMPGSEERPAHAANELNASSDGIVTEVATPAASIDRRIWVNLIQVADDDGTDLANVFGNPDSTMFIMNKIDEIWAQAGIDVAYTGGVTRLNNSFVNDGAHDAYPQFGGIARPARDLNMILSLGDTAGVGDPSNTIIDAYFVQNAPLYERGEFFTQGIANIGAPGTAINNRADPSSLTTFNQSVMASLFAHEIGHNLGLFHVSDQENLMFGTVDGQGNGLTPEQIETVRNSFLVSGIPEPSSLLLCILAGGIALRRSRV